jgi:N-acetyl-anhydromuramyl-L-alanine amidase AmpD
MSIRSLLYAITANLSEPRPGDLMAKSTQTPFETDNWPLVQAKHFQRHPGPRPVRVIVLHTAETPETERSAAGVANYFHTVDRPASSHIVVDADRIIQCVRDSDIAYAAPKCNHDGIQIEMAGYSAQTEAGWSDPYSQKMLKLVADAVAQYCLKYGITPQHLTNSELKAGLKGIVGHFQVSQVYKKSTHTDPGGQFPWASFMKLVMDAYDRRRTSVLRNIATPTIEGNNV